MHHFYIPLIFISAIGRLDLGTGPLTNLTEGGTGSRDAGRAGSAKLSHETRLKSGRTTFARGVGIFARTLEEHRAHSRKGALAQVVAGTTPAQLRTVCPHCGIESNMMILKRWHFANCRLNPDQTGANRVRIEHAQMSIFHRKIECPYCGETGQTAAMNRYHIPNCRNKPHIPQP